MNRRTFKIPALRLPREQERGRIQQRLQALTGDEQPSEHIEDTRELAAQRPGPDTERGAPALEPPTHARTSVRAGLYHLNGPSFADLPCDNLHGVIVLGRGETASVKIDDAYVHRVHAHLRWDTEGKIHVIAHGGGENGTYVNRKRISEPVRLNSGARIRLGRSEFIYRVQWTMAATVLRRRAEPAALDRLLRNANVGRHNLERQPPTTSVISTTGEI